MKKDNLQKCFSFELINRINNESTDKLTKNQERAIFRIIDEKQIYCFTYIKPVSKTKWFWRLTFPLYLIMIILSCFFVLPIKWVFTGEFRYDTTKGVLGKPIGKWSDKLKLY